MKNQRGQLLIESVLLLIVFVSVSLTVANYFRKKQVFAALLHGPWSYMQGMIECGVWEPEPRAHGDHPNMLRRNHTVTGDPI